MNDRSCLVAGGAGFLGSALVAALVREAWHTRVLTRTSPREVVSGASYIQGSINDRRAAREALAGVNVLFHFASSTTPATAHGKSSWDVESNLMGTIALLEEAAAAGVERVIFASSGGTVYGPPVQVPVAESHPTDPICSHGIVKLAIEKYLQLFSHQQSLTYTILRYANPYGPGQLPDRAQGAVAVLLGKVLGGEAVDLFGDGSVVRDFLYVDDLVEATLLAASSEAARNETMNVGSGAPTSIRELVRAIERAAGVNAIIHHRPARPFDVPVSILDIAKASRLLHWQPRTSLDDGLRQTADWMRGWLAGSGRSPAAASIAEQSEE